MTVLKNAKIYTMQDDPVASGDIAIENGKILQIAKQIDTGGTGDVIDCHGQWVFPGLVDAHSHIGLFEDSIGFEGDDGNEATDPVTPHLRVIDAINPRDRSFAEAVSHGITCAVTAPGSANVICGQMAAIKTFGRYMDDMILKAPVGMKAALGENPKRVYHEQKKAPSTRMSSAAILRETLFQAKVYHEQKQKKDDSFKPDFKMEAMEPVITGEIPLHVHAHRSDDIVTALRIAEEFSLKIVLVHCTDGYTMLDKLKEQPAGILLGPLFTERSKVELHNLSLEAPAAFEKENIKFALTTDHPVIPAQHLIVQLALCVREGLSEMAAFKAVTIHAAEIAGISERVGSLRPGKDADIAVFDGNPLDYRTKTLMTLVSGQIAYRRKGF
ncbi:MAG: amidohydrolase [Christensenellales bacterium]